MPYAVLPHLARQREVFLDKVETWGDSAPVLSPATEPSS